MSPMCQTLLNPVATGKGKLGNEMRLIPTLDGFVWKIYAGKPIWIECGPAEDFETPEAAKRWLVESGGIVNESN